MPLCNSLFLWPHSTHVDSHHLKKRSRGINSNTQMDTPSSCTKLGPVWDTFHQKILEIEELSKFWTPKIEKLRILLACILCLFSYDISRIVMITETPQRRKCNYCHQCGLYYFSMTLSVLGNFSVFQSWCTDWGKCCWHLFCIPLDNRPPVCPVSIISFI